MDIKDVEYSHDDMVAIRKRLEEKTQNTFEEFDRQKRNTYIEINTIVLD